MPSTGSGTRTVVTTAELSSSGEKSSRPIALTPSRQARPSRTCSLEGGLEAALEDHAERHVQADDDRDGRRECRVERLLRHARALPVEVEARTPWRARAPSRPRRRRRPCTGRAAPSAPSASRRRPSRAPTRRSRREPRRGSRSRRRRSARRPPWQPRRTHARRQTTPVDVSDCVTSTAVAPPSLGEPRREIVGGRRLAPLVARCARPRSRRRAAMSAQRSPK